MGVLRPAYPLSQCQVCFPPAPRANARRTSALGSDCLSERNMNTSPATVVPERAGRSGLQALLQRRPLVAYFVLAYLGTWLVFAPVVVSQRGLGLLTLPDALGLILFFV